MPPIVGHYTRHVHFVESAGASWAQLRLAMSTAWTPLSRANTSQQELAFER